MISFNQEIKVDCFVTLLFLVKYFSSLLNLVPGLSLFKENEIERQETYIRYDKQFEFKLLMNLNLSYQNKFSD
jgi:hypothetical protein